MAWTWCARSAGKVLQLYLAAATQPQFELAAQAAAPSMHAVESLPLGVVSSDAAVVRGLRGFCDRLSASTGVSVEPRTVDSNQALVAGVADDSLAAVWAPPLVALELHQRQLAEPLVVLQRGFRAGYHSALFALVRSEIREVTQLHGTRVAWVSEDSTSGYVAPRWHLRAIGHPADSLFAEERFYGGHTQVVRAILGGQADVGATHVAVDAESGQLRSAPWLELGVEPREIQVILLIGPIPGDVIAFSRSRPQALRQRFAAALLALPADARAFAEVVFQAHRFDPAPSGHLDLLRGLARDGRKPG